MQSSNKQTNDMRVLITILAATMISCASARETRVAEYREITKDICRDNPHEIRLAQQLYISYVVNNNR